MVIFATPITTASCKLPTVNCKLLTENGELAHLARALAWHARGNRFDSGILHKL